MRTGYKWNPPGSRRLYMMISLSWRDDVHCVKCMRTLGQLDISTDVSQDVNSEINQIHVHVVVTRVRDEIILSRVGWFKRQE